MVKRRVYINAARGGKYVAADDMGYCSLEFGDGLDTNRFVSAYAGTDKSNTVATNDRCFHANDYYITVFFIG